MKTSICAFRFPIYEFLIRFFNVVFFVFSYAFVFFDDVETFEKAIPFKFLYSFIVHFTRFSRNFIRKQNFDFLRFFSYASVTRKIGFFYIKQFHLKLFSSIFKTHIVIRSGTSVNLKKVFTKNIP